MEARPPGAVGQNGHPRRPGRCNPGHPEREKHGPDPSRAEDKGERLNGKAQATKLASMAQNGYARTMRPAHSMVGGL
ncbi:MAG: hypothetical protein C0390_12770 [Syntrophus sp. (in: bacteria)]|nr:hypothetical protein [Syntrophus sp. (in: bacteria)]